MASRNIAPHRSRNGAGNGPSGPAGRPDIAAPMPRFGRRSRPGSGRPRRRSSAPARRRQDRPRPLPGRAPGRRSPCAARSRPRTPPRARRAARRAETGHGPRCGLPRDSPRSPCVGIHPPASVERLATHTSEERPVSGRTPPVLRSMERRLFHLSGERAHVRRMERRTIQAQSAARRRDLVSRRRHRPGQ